MVQETVELQRSCTFTCCKATFTFAKQNIHFAVGEHSLARSAINNSCFPSLQALRFLLQRVLIRGSKSCRTAIPRFQCVRARLPSLECPLKKASGILFRSLFPPKVSPRANSKAPLRSSFWLFLGSPSIRLSTARRKNKSRACRKRVQGVDAVQSILGSGAFGKGCGIFPIVLRFRFLRWRKAGWQSRRARPVQASKCFPCSRRDTAGSVRGKGGKNPLCTCTYRQTLATQMLDKEKLKLKISQFFSLYYYRKKSFDS